MSKEALAGCSDVVNGTNCSMGPNGDQNGTQQWDPAMGPNGKGTQWDPVQDFPREGSNIGSCGRCVGLQGNLVYHFGFRRNFLFDLTET